MAADGASASHDVSSRYTSTAAMAVDDGPSRMADIAARLTADANHASQYRLRLIAADMIRPYGHGHGNYTLPYLRDHPDSTEL